MRFLFAPLAITALIAGQVFAQKTPKPTPTPVPGSQIERNASRVTPDQTSPDVGGGRVNKTGIGQSGNETGATDSIKALEAGRIAKILIIVKTGSDDLRNNSTFSAFLITRDGRRIDSAPLNCEVMYELPGRNHCIEALLSPCIPESLKGMPVFKKTQTTGMCPGIPNDQSTVVYWTLDKSVVIYPADLGRFGISFRSGKSGDLDTGDNWNLDELEAAYVVEGGSSVSPAGQFLLFKGSGKPLYRFSTQEEWQTPLLRLPQ